MGVPSDDVVIPSHLIGVMVSDRLSTLIVGGR